MAHIIEVLSSDDEEVIVVGTIPATIIEMTEQMIFERYDFRPVRSTQLAANMPFDMYFNEAILAADCEATQTTLKPSSIAVGTLGLYTTVSVEGGTSYAYWGMLRLQRVGTSVLLDDKERAVKFQFQPFLEKFQIEMFLLGSLSCCATYMNDKNYLRIEGEDRNRRNNCHIVETRFDELTTFLRTADFDMWLDHGPLNTETKMGVIQDNELSCDYLM